MTRSINIRMTEEELAKLVERAQRELRHPRDQAKWFILDGLQHSLDASARTPSGDYCPHCGRSEFAADYDDWPDNTEPSPPQREKIYASGL